MPITPSLRHCSNKYKLAREGEKDKEKDEDFEKEKVQFFFFTASLEAVKLRHLLHLFTQIYRVFINKVSFLHNYLKNIMLRLQTNINIQGDLKTDAFER